MAQLPIAIGETLDGKYRIDRVLGQGGMGVVVAATQLNLDRQVAIKFLLGDHAEDKELVERFVREAKALVKLENCENVARVLDVGQMSSGASYMVMEYLEGQDLSRVLRTRGVLPVAEVVSWLCEACEGIAAAHAMQIVHRDLKPANLFLAQRANERTVVKVLDFGISKALAGSPQEQFALTKTAALLGSPLYMAPEQIQASRDADARTDIWALGVILYELLTGRSPFLADSLGSLVHTILHEQPQAPHEIRPEIPLDLSGVVLRCLAKAKEDRWLSVRALHGALLAFAPPTATTGPRQQAVSSLASTASGPPGGPPLGTPPPGTPPLGTPVVNVPSSPPVPVISDTPASPLAVTPSRSDAKVAEAVGEKTGRDTAWGTTTKQPKRSGSRLAIAIASFAGLALFVVAQNLRHHDDLKVPASSSSTASERDKQEGVSEAPNVSSAHAPTMPSDPATNAADAGAPPLNPTTQIAARPPLKAPVPVPPPSAKPSAAPAQSVTAPVTPTNSIGPSHIPIK